MLVRPRPVLALTALLLGVGALAMVSACASTDACATPGSTTECAQGFICADDILGRECLAICTKQSDCSSTDECTGVSSTNLKACHPTQASEAHGW
jgi:hypothetical protein